MSAPAGARASIVAVLAAMALAVLDAGIVNVALPALGGAFDAAPAEAILIVSAYQLALLMGLLPCAHLGERFGQRRLFTAGIVLFTLASMLATVMPSLPALVAMRFVQGLGASAIMALGIALLRAALGTDRLAAAIGWNALTVAICSAAGPALGALILALGSWRWLFLAALPLGLITLVAARSLPEGEAAPGLVDAAGIALHALTAILLFLGVKLLVWHLPAALALLAAALLCLALIVRRALGRSAPLVPLDLLARPGFRGSVLASICCFTAQSAGIVALPFYLHDALGQGPLAAGAILACWPLAVGAASAAANRSAAFSAERQCAAGAALLAAGLLAAAATPLRASVWPLAIAVLLCGAGFGLFQLANNRILFLSAPAGRSAAAGGMQGTARLLGQLGGTMLAAPVFASVASPVLAPRIAFAGAAAFALAAALVSATRPGRHPGFATIVEGEGHDRSAR